MTKKYDITRYIIMYILGYFFFISYIYSQLLISFHNISIVLIFSISILFMPLTFFYVVKKLSTTKVDSKMYFIYTIVSNLYLFLTSIIVVYFISFLIKKYYLEIPIYIISIVLLIPLLMISSKYSNFFYSFSYIFLAICIIYELVYMFNINTLDIYPITNIIPSNNIFMYTMMMFVLILEPLLILSDHHNISKQKRINKKLIWFTCFFIIFATIYNIIRITLEFGLLNEKLSFPFFESYRILKFGAIENIDIYYLIFIIILLYSRLPILICNLKDNYSLKNSKLYIIYIIFIISIYYLDMRLEFYVNIIIPVMLILNFLLLGLFFMSFFFKREEKT